ncbi:hypothetical protein IF655_10865 [Streptomyces sp. DSM 110735]|uniref:hypothetical protein n=1 Tax=Streptomyces sp. DSM 110735 TaxID=2775031 RepID=UPI0018F719E6|nr:hypothetical protein [Streptomyces sp. DSM 110735]MBJ7903799.1 hypothetical protein [Streptomyces sp. DSM 110735]
MANGVWHTGYHIKIELTHADLGHPDRPELLDEITLPIEQRDRELLQCPQHHGTGICRAEEEDRSPWMTIRRRTVGRGHDPGGRASAGTHQTNSR